MSYDLDLDLDNICRVCLTQNEKLVNLFTKQIVDGYIRTMPVIVQYCLDIIVDENDILPKKICENCKATIINYFTFKERCKRTEKVLLEALQKIQKTSNTLMNSEENQNLLQSDNASSEKDAELVLLGDISEKLDQPDPGEQNETAMSEDPVIADFTEQMDVNLVDDDAIVEESFVEGNDDQKTIEFIVDIPEDTVRKKDFDYVSRENSNESEAQEEEEEEHLLDESLEDILEGSDTEEFYCALCQKFCRHKYIDHCRNYHFLCTECLLVFDTEEELKDHRKAEHEFVTSLQMTRTKKHSGNSLLCQICNKRWGTADQLNQHMKLHQALEISMENKFNCHECRQCHTVYLKSEDLDDHMNVHDSAKSFHTDDPICTDYQFLEEVKPPGQFTCGFCKATYASMDQMRCHIIIHFDSFSCPFDSCGCEYDTFSRLSLHIMKKHVYGEEHFCTHCRKERFATFDELQLHIRNDCTAKKFSCHHCDKKFFSNKALQLHIKHAGDKKYECQHCGKTFAQHGELNIHLRTHTGERPFKCTICSKTYRTASMRAAHMDAHINGKTFQCTVCSKMLQSRTSYRNHMRRHTMGKSYKCSECSKSFYTKYHLDLHTTKIHNKSREVRS